MQVAAFGADPGVFSRMAVIEPPIGTEPITPPARAKRGDRFKPVGQRHQQRERGGAPKPGHRPENQAHHHAASKEEQFLHMQQAGDTGPPHIQHVLASHPAISASHPAASCRHPHPVLFPQYVRIAHII